MTKNKTLTLKKISIEKENIIMVYVYERKKKELKLGFSVLFLNRIPSPLLPKIHAQHNIHLYYACSGLHRRSTDRKLSR